MAVVDGSMTGISVKNTFIDVRWGDIVSDDEDESALNVDTMKCRQVSEPTPIIRRQVPVEKPAPPQEPVQEEEESDPEASTSCGESEQDDELSLSAAVAGNHGLYRQQTEQVWPSWNCAASEFSPAASASATCESLPVMPGGASSSHDSLPLMYPASASCDSLPLIQEAQSSDVDSCVDMVWMYPSDWGNTSTLMVRNLPNKYTQQLLLQELGESGFQGCFDFLYLPIDPETNANRGYCFVNFLTPYVAWRFKATYEGRKMCQFNSGKVVTIVAAALQGFEANYAHYSTSRVCRGDPSARPLFLRESFAKPAPWWPEGGGGGRRRGGRKEVGSLIDQAVKQREQHELKFQMPVMRNVQPNQSTDQRQQRVNDVHWFGIPQRPEEESSVTFKFCPFCAGKLQSGFKFCPSCGSSLEDIVAGAATCGDITGHSHPEDED